LHSASYALAVAHVVGRLFARPAADESAFPVEPLGYVGSAVTHALPLSLIEAALLGCSLPSLVDWRGRHYRVEGGGQLVRE